MIQGLFVILLMLALWAGSAEGAGENPAAPPEPKRPDALTKEEKDIIDMMEMLEMMEALKEKDMGMLQHLDEMAEED